MKIAADLIATTAAKTRLMVITYTTAKTGEVARYTLIPGASFANLYTGDLKVLEALFARLNRMFPASIYTKAAGELLSSRAVSMEGGIGNNPAATSAHAYTQVAPGLKVHNDTGHLHVTGVLVKKITLTPGVHKPVKSSDLTKAKNRIRRRLPSGKIRQFPMPGITRLAAEGEVLVIE